MNKKAIIGDAVDVIFTIIAGIFCFIVLSLFLQLPLHAAQEASNMRVAESQTEQLFNQFIQSTIEYRGQKITILELASSNFAEDKETKLHIFKQQANNIFGPTILYTPDSPEYTTQKAVKGWEDSQPWMAFIYENGNAIGGVSSFIQSSSGPREVLSCQNVISLKQSALISTQNSKQIVFCMFEPGIKLLNHDN